MTTETPRCLACGTALELPGVTAELERLERTLSERDRDLRECVELLERASCACEEDCSWCVKKRALLAQIKAGQRENHRCQHCGNYDCELHQERTS